MKDDLFFCILFHRNIPVVFSDVLFSDVVFSDVVVGIAVVIALNTVPGVFPFFFKLMSVPIVIPNIIRTTKIIKNIIHIVFLLRKCSHLE